MNAVGINAVQLLLLLWTLTAVCQAHDGDISVICEDVTGTVREEVTLTCSVSLKCSERCIKLYKFQYLEGDSAICRDEFPDDCEQRDRLTCRFTPTTAKTEQFRFFVQTLCGRETTEFTVNITEPIKPVTQGPGKEDPKTDPKTEHNKLTGTGSAFNNTAIAAVVGCFFFILIIIISLTILYKRKSNDQPQWFPVFLDRRHDEDISDRPVNVV